MFSYTLAASTDVEESLTAALRWPMKKCLFLKNCKILNVSISTENSSDECNF